MMLKSCARTRTTAWRCCAQVSVPALCSGFRETRHHCPKLLNFLSQNTLHTCFTRGVTLSPCALVCMHNRLILCDYCSIFVNLHSFPFMRTRLQYTYALSCLTSLADTIQSTLLRRRIIAVTATGPIRFSARSTRSVVKLCVTYGQAIR
jgi:hypothetical protein